MPKQLSINLLTSKIFWQSMPLIISEIARRNHYLCVYSQDQMPSIDALLDCDVLIDMSAIVDVSFYEGLLDEYLKRNSTGKKVPVMVDNPRAVMNSMDKRRTHALIPDLSPGSYNLDGLNNAELINIFKDDKYVVVKDPFGWQARGVYRLSPKEALEKYKSTKDLIVQKYIPFTDGVGRILTLDLSPFKTHNKDFSSPPSF
jgi:glutathione synthase/RimK-type ligase-like ATP-grasp enzyme